MLGGHGSWNYSVLFFAAQFVSSLITGISREGMYKRLF
jgi:hypothetical protein